MFQLLINRVDFKCIPTYICLLSQDCQIPALLEKIPLLKTLEQDDINAFLHLSHINDLPVLEMSVALIKKMIDDEQDFQVSHMHWIYACESFVNDGSPDVKLAYLRYTMIICRKFLIMENVSKLEEVFSGVNFNFFE